MKTIVVGFMRCLCHYRGRVVEEEEVEATLADMRRTEGELPAYFVGGEFTKGREYFSDEDAEAWTKLFRKRVATAVAGSLDVNNPEPCTAEESS